MTMMLMIIVVLITSLKKSRCKTQEHLTQDTFFIPAIHRRGLSLSLGGQQRPPMAPGHAYAAGGRKVLPGGPCHEVAARPLRRGEIFSVGYFASKIFRYSEM